MLRTCLGDEKNEKVNKFCTTNGKNAIDISSIPTYNTEPRYFQFRNFNRF